MLESFTQFSPNPSPLSALLSSTTVCTLVATDEHDLKSRLLVDAFAIAGTSCAAHLMRHWAFWRPRLDVVEALLKLTPAEPDIDDFMTFATLPSLPWPPSTSPTSDLTANSKEGQNPSVSGMDHTVDSIARALLEHVNVFAQAEDGAVWFLRHHIALARVYAYYGKLLDVSSQLLCASLESLAYLAADELLRPKRRQQGCGTGRTWFDSTALWAVCEKFGPRLKKKILGDMSVKVEELFHGKSVSEDGPFTFAEWGMCAYLIAKLDPCDRRRVLAGVNPILAGTNERTVTVADEAARKRLLNSGLPLALLGLA